MHIKDIYNHVRTQLTSTAIDNADFEARIILQEYADIAWADLIAKPDTAVPQEKFSAVNEALKQRLSGKPLSRIMGYKEFWGLRFDLNDHTLDPRPETEILVEHVLNWVSENDLQNKPIRILDLGTGTGCIPITLLTELPAATAIAADLSQDALDMAQQNAARHDVAGRIAFQKSNWFSNIDGQFDVIVSNPPYIDSNDVPNLHPDVQNHDPILALDGGKNGIEPYEIIFSSLKNFLKPGGAAFFEIGAEQCGYITRLSEKTMSRIEAIYPDLAGIPRVVQITCGDK